jgi:hypothetical protein
MKCRQCLQNEATVAIRSGLEWHPTCSECAEWWGSDRQGPLSEVEQDYYDEREPENNVDTGQRCQQ